MTDIANIILNKHPRFKDKPTSEPATITFIEWHCNTHYPNESPHGYSEKYILQLEGYSVENAYKNVRPVLDINVDGSEPTLIEMAVEFYLSLSDEEEAKSLAEAYVHGIIQQEW